MTPSGRVIVAGSLNMDLVVATPRFPRAGETVMGADFQTLPGGKGLNQAAAAARLGAKVTMLGCVGHDAFGERLLEVIRAEGVDASAVRVAPDASTGIALITVSEGENSIVVVSGANMAMTQADIASTAILAGDVLVAQLETPIEVTEHLFARGQGIATTILNAAPARAVPESLLALVDLLVVNETELATMARPSLEGESALPDIIAAARGLRRPGKTVIVTLGRRGAVLLQDDAPPEVVAGHPVEAVDSTGAGDCFVGAYAAALAGKRRSALEFANAAAAVAVTRLGAAPAMPHLADVEALMRI